jgi:hypothetical protein
MSDQFGGSGIRKDLFDYVVENFKPGSTIVELGAGYVSTKFLGEIYNLYSIEDKKEYLGIYNSNYIHAPLENGWYSPAAIAKGLAGVNADLTIVDGPTGEGNRHGFSKHIHLFKSANPIIVDDIHRQGEIELAEEISRLTKRDIRYFDSFCVI